MNRFRLVLLSIASMVAFQGCAHSALETKVDNDVAREEMIKTRADLRVETAQLIQSVPGLSADQRSQLSTLRDSTRTQLDEMRLKSLKLRSVLVKDLISTTYNEDEVDLIKQRMKDLEDSSLAVTFSSVEKANLILGHEAIANNQLIMNDFFEGEGRGRRD